MKSTSLLFVLSAVAFSFALAGPQAQAASKKSTQVKTDEVVASASSTSGSGGPSHWLTSGATKSVSFSFPSGGNAGVGGSYALDDEHSLRAEFGFDLNYQSSTTWGVSFDLGYRTYLKKISSIKVFMQPNIFLAKSPSGSTFAKSIILSPGFAAGAEYFISENVSVGVSTGLALTFSNGFSNFRLATGTSGISANFYF